MLEKKDPMEGVKCTCGRSPEELQEKGHIMGCDIRSRHAAVFHWEYEQAQKRVQRLLEIT